MGAKGVNALWWIPIGCVVVVIACLVYLVETFVEKPPKNSDWKNRYKQ